MANVAQTIPTDLSVDGSLASNHWSRGTVSAGLHPRGAQEQLSTLAGEDQKILGYFHSPTEDLLVNQAKVLEPLTPPPSIVDDLEELAHHPSTTDPNVDHGNVGVVAAYEIATPKGLN